MFQVPGFEQWFNIVYDGEDTVKTHRLNDDLKNGYLRIL